MSCHQIRREYLVKKRSMLMLITYAVEASHALRVWRAMYELDFDVGVCFYQRTNGDYTEDDLNDFRTRESLIDLTDRSPSQFFTEVESYIKNRDVELIVQVGFEPLYPYFPTLKAHFPQLKIVDMIFNEVGHTVSHFLFERCIDATIVESQYMKRFMIDCSDLNEPDIRVIENGIDINSFPARSDKKKSDTFTVGYVGRLSAEKNPLGFVKIAEALAPRLREIDFKIFGNGPMREEIEKAVNQQCIGNRLSFLGYTNPVTDALSQIDMLIVPSLFDGRPNIIMEANACGIPVIAAPVGGIPEMIEEGINGYLCPPNHIGAIFDIINMNHSKSDTYDELCKTSREFAGRRFDRYRMIKAYEEAFRNI